MSLTFCGPQKSGLILDAQANELLLQFRLLNTSIYSLSVKMWLTRQWSCVPQTSIFIIKQLLVSRSKHCTYRN